MKKLIRIEDLCCKRCADRMANKLECLDGVLSARGNYRKNIILVQTQPQVTDEILCSAIKEAGFTVLAIEERKGLFYS